MLYFLCYISVDCFILINRIHHKGFVFTLWCHPLMPLHNVSLATNVDGSVGNTEIAEMWKCHYKSPLNSAQNKEFKKFVLLDTNQQHESSNSITPFDILDALKSISVVNLAVLMTFPQNTLYLFIVAFTFYYPCYFLHLLHMVICQICS